MSKDKISDYSATANSNTDIAGINIDEGCAPSGINNAIRTLMKQLKDFQQGTNSDSFNGPTNGAHNGTVGATTPAAGTFTTLTASGNVVLGDASTDTLNVGSGGLVKDASGNVGVGTASPGVKLDTVGVIRSTFDSASNGGATSHGLSLRQSTTSTKALVAGYSTSGSQTGAYIQAVNFGTAYEDLVLQPNGGNIGLGVTPSAWSATYKALQVGGSVGLWGGASSELAILSSNAYLGGSGYARIIAGYATRYTQNVGTHSWSTAATSTSGSAITWTDAMTLDASGNLLVGTTTAGAGIGWSPRLAVDGGSNYGAIFKSGSSGAGYECIDCWNIATSGNNSFINFYSDAGASFRGNITYNRGAGQVAYNTTSDYRLKENIVDLPNALAVVAQLKPRQFDWKETNTTTTGFIAHELAEVCPHAVTGDKDAVDEEGNPVYQGIDTSFLVATLTAAIQEQQAIITQLQADVAALKGN